MNYNTYFVRSRTYFTLKANNIENCREKYNFYIIFLNKMSNLETSNAVK